MAKNPPIVSAATYSGLAEHSPTYLHPDPVQKFEDTLSWPLIMPKKDFKSILGEENSGNPQYHMKSFAKVSRGAGIFGDCILKYPGEKLMNVYLSMWRVKRGIETDNVEFAMFTWSNLLQIFIERN